MGCSNIICGKQTYDYLKEQKLLQKCLLEFSYLNKCYCHDFVTKCYKNLILNPDAYILKYDKKLELKQVVPHTILEKWKLILYGTHIDIPNYVDCIGFDKQVQQQRIASKTYRFSKRNPFEIRLQDLYFHESYRQIEKDSGRVYLVPQIKQQLFQKLLKKIANHFPQSGYSLGINYIIGYFLLVGMSQMDSFWMFIHLALNEKFLALGFFENQLPLMKVVVEIFKNILRRKNKELYNHIYKNLQVDDTSWILKWVTSFFLSTFPIQFCHYILDYVFTFGILGLSIVSFGIVNFFQNLIFKCEEATDFILLFQKLLNFQYLSHSVPIGQFMSSIYEINLQERDFDLLGQIDDNFYVQYFILFSEWKFRSNKQSRQKMDQLLSAWYQQNRNKRLNFTRMARTFDGKFFQPNQSSSKMEDTQSFHHSNLQATKEQKLAEKSEKEHSFMFKNLQNFSIKIPQQMRLSLLENVQTIKVSSRNKKLQKQSDQVQSNQQPSEDSVNFQFSQIQKIKRLKSERHLKNDQHGAQRKVKTEGDQVENLKKNEFFRDRSERFSIKSFSHLDKESEQSISFNQKPLNQEISKRLNLTQTLPMRNKNSVNALQEIHKLKTLNSSDNLVLFLNKLVLNDQSSQKSVSKKQEQIVENVNQNQTKNEIQKSEIKQNENKHDGNNNEGEENQVEKKIVFQKSEIKTLKQLQSLFQKPSQKVEIEISIIKANQNEIDKANEQITREKSEQIENDLSNEQNQIQNLKVSQNDKNQKQNEDDRTVRLSFSSVMVDDKINNQN